MTEFRRDQGVDEPGVVGARWWHTALVAREQHEASRRKALVALAALGAGAGLAAAFATCRSSDNTAAETRVEKRSSLAMQREYGWEFGAPDDNLVFDGEQITTFDREQLRRLASDLKPERYAALYTPTALEAITATPLQSRPTEENRPFRPLSEVLRPVHTAAMDHAYAVGLALADLVGDPSFGVMPILDLPGPLSIATAAGMAMAFVPVLGIDNWPHPQAVVPVHQALGACAYYQPRFRAAKAERSSTALPALVLDRQRLMTYGSASDKFDNRHLIRQYPPTAFRGVGAKHLLYVVEDKHSFLPHDDVLETFLAAKGAGIPVRVVSLDVFSATSNPASDDAKGLTGQKLPVHYGGSAATHRGFFLDYPFTEAPARAVAHPDPGRLLMGAYTPTVRPPMYGPGGPLAANLGTVAVVLAATGAVLGAQFDRRGSWNRVPRSSSGGFFRSWGGG